MKKDYWLPAAVLLLPISMGLVKLKFTVNKLAYNFPIPPSWEATIDALTFKT